MSKPGYMLSPYKLSSICLFSVAVLNPEFLQLPVQAVECSLANLPGSDKKKSKFVHKFLEMVNGKELVCRMDERDERGKYLVLIIDSGDGETVNINEEMAEFIACSGKQGASKGRVIINFILLHIKNKIGNKTF